MDPELRAYLEARREETVATRTVAEAAVQAATAAERRAEAARTEARVLHEDTMQAIGVVIEGINVLHAATEFRAQDRERDMMNRHIAPLEASAANHERRITVLENGR